MDKILHHIFERTMAVLPGWMFLLSGLVLLGLALVLPTWRDVQDLAWQRDLMQMQAQRMQLQAQHYEDFHRALLSDDPVLLERLAFSQLRLKSVDKRPLDLMAWDPAKESGSNSRGRGEAAFVALHPASRTGPSPAEIETSGTVNLWLAEPMPVVGVDVASPQRANTRLNRLTQGPSRLGLIAAAIACVIGGVWSTGEDKKAI